MKPHHLAFMVVITFVWALSLAAASVGMEDMPPLLFTGMRFLILALLLAPILSWHKGQMGDIAIVAMCAGGVQFGLFFTGIHIAEDLSSVAIAAQLGVPFTTLLSMILLGEQVGWRRWVGMLLSFCGVMVISFDPRVLGYIDGMAFGVLAAFIGAFAIIVMRRLRSIGVFALQAWVAMLSWPLLLPLSIAVEGSGWQDLTGAPWQAWAAVIFSAVISSLVAHAGLYWMVQRYEVSKVSPLTLMTPLFAVILGVALLGDQLTWRMMLGGVLTLCGVLVISLREPASTVAAERGAT